MSKYLGISLFASGGIGDLALRASDIDVIVANELLADRVSIFKHNFPNTEVFGGNIWDLQEEIVNKTKELLNGRDLDFLLATPPCQGMSKNGQGKLLNLIRSGKRPPADERNRLIIPTIKIIKELKPNIVVFENVPEMENTIIEDENGNFINIIEFIKDSLGQDYTGNAEVVEFADYGIPQRRKRLITVFSKNENFKKHFDTRNTFLPTRTHSKEPNMFQQSWVSVRDVISDLPPLDGRDEISATSDIPYHYVSVLDPKKYVWISNTAPEKGAFDNQCINPECLFKENPTHGAERTNGINQAKTTTPLYCIKCGEILPRPYTVDKDGSKRIMSGFTSAYKRMCWDLPSSTLTTNLSYPSSDHKLHPEQHRVLSLCEAFKLHTLDRFDYEWKHHDGKNARDTIITEIIGESIPPLGLQIIFDHLINIYEGKVESTQAAINDPLLYRLKNSI